MVQHWLSTHEGSRDFSAQYLCFVAVQIDSQGGSNDKEDQPFYPAYDGRASPWCFLVIIFRTQTHLPVSFARAFEDKKQNQQCVNLQ
jgi:hypothetical protein